MIFSTKAKTLSKLEGRLRCAQIAPLHYFTVGKWRENNKLCLKKIHALAADTRWIVRSSCQREDGTTASNAGAFLSLLNIDSCDLKPSIDQVIAAYEDENDMDEVLVQPMLSNVACSGVAFSHDPNTCTPYRVINWSEGQDTSTITGGFEGKVWQQAAGSRVPVPETIVGVNELIEELLSLFSQQPIDCEFAITHDGEDRVVWLLQVRPLILSHNPETSEAQLNRLDHIEKKVIKGMLPHPFLMGKKTVYGVMPDWNPAEIIGIRPKPLALSLYRDLITDSIWAFQRHNYGYRNLRSFPLMPHFFGLPYIDIRVSFNSFIPAELDEKLAGRLVDYYIERLISEPMLHDKVEFEIVLSCYSLDLQEKLDELKKAGFSGKDCQAISDSLRRLTNSVIHPKEGLWKSDFAKLDKLIERRETLLASGSDQIERIYWLLEDGKRYGTLPFAGLARAGFIAIQMLKSLVNVGVFSQRDYEVFIESVSTVSGQLASDRTRLDKTTFLSRYGHLRPGTYDVLSPRYDEAPENYFDWQKKSEMESVAEQKVFSFTLPQMRALAKLLDEHGLDIDPIALLDFLQAGIELRELAKFHFTRNLSDAMALMEDYAQQHGISRDDLAFCDLSAFKELYISAADPRQALLQSIEAGKTRYIDSQALCLPPLISSPEDVWGFMWPETAPNFITQKQVTAKVTDGLNRNCLRGSIVCIPNADPGYDWLFSYPIAGLITAWGGVNSHMAIRAGELGLPSAIGAGELLFHKWSNAKRLHLDCAGRRVEVLH